MDKLQKLLNIIKDRKDTHQIMQRICIEDNNPELEKLYYAYYCEVSVIEKIIEKILQSE